MHPCRLGMPFIRSVTSRGKEDDGEIAQQLLHQRLSQILFLYSAKMTENPFFGTNVSFSKTELIHLIVSSVAVYFQKCIFRGFKGRSIVSNCGAQMHRNYKKISLLYIYIYK